MLAGLCWTDLVSGLQSSGGKVRGIHQARSTAAAERCDSEPAPQNRTGSHQGGLWGYDRGNKVMMFKVR